MWVHSPETKSGESVSATKARVRVLLVDDHPLVLEGMREVLGDDHSLQVVGAAATAQEALEMARAEDPDVIFFDTRLAENSGFDLISEMRRTSSARGVSGAGRL